MSCSSGLKCDTYDLSIEFGQPGLTIVIEHQDSVDHLDCSSWTLEVDPSIWMLRERSYQTGIDGLCCLNASVYFLNAQLWKLYNNLQNHLNLTQHTINPCIVKNETEESSLYMLNLSPASNSPPNPFYAYRNSSKPTITATAKQTH